MKCCLHLAGRIEASLEASQPQEQHGCRHGRHIEEYLLTANIAIDKTLATGSPICIVSSALFFQVVRSDIWVFLVRSSVAKCLRFKAVARLTFVHVFSRRPGCFVRARQLAMLAWRGDAVLIGLVPPDGSPNLLDLRFADDMLSFSNSGHEASWWLDNLVRCCSHVGLLLNMDKTKIASIEAKAPSQLFTPSGPVVDILSDATPLCYHQSEVMIFFPMQLPYATINLRFMAPPTKRNCEGEVQPRRSSRICLVALH